jgi:hypothetical protein
VLEWDFDRIVLSHGDLIEHDGHARAAQAWRPLVSARQPVEPPRCLQVGAPNIISRPSMPSEPDGYTISPSSLRQYRPLGMKWDTGGYQGIRWRVLRSRCRQVSQTGIKT